MYIQKYTKNVYHYSVKFLDCSCRGSIPQPVLLVEASKIQDDYTCYSSGVWLVLQELGHFFYAMK